MIQSGIGGLAAAFSASAFASTKLKGNEKMMPVDTLNHEPGWDKEPVEVLEIKGVRIGEGRPMIIPRQDRRRWQTRFRRILQRLLF